MAMTQEKINELINTPDYQTNREKQAIVSNWYLQQAQ
jgi:hypothetical protein